MSYRLCLNRTALILLFSILLSSCFDTREHVYVLFRENLKVAIPDDFVNMSDQIFLNDNGQNAWFVARDSSSEVFIALNGDSTFNREVLSNSIKTELSKRHPDIRLVNKILNIPTQNTGYFYSYSSNCTIGACIYMSFHAQNLRIDYQGNKEEQKNDYEEFIKIVNSIMTLNDI